VREAQQCLRWSRWRRPRAGSNQGLTWSLGASRGWLPSTERDTKRTRPCSSPFPCPGHLARHGGGVNGGACTIAARRRQAPLIPATRREGSPAEERRPRTQGLKINRPGSFPDIPRYSQLPGDTTDGDYWLMLVLGGQVGWFDEVKRKWSVRGRGRPRYWRGIVQQLAAAGIYRRTLTATNHNTLPNSYDKDHLSRPVDSGLGSNGRSDRQLF
jgi:hypothetical protein